MELTRYLGELRRRLWLIILVGIVSAGAAAAFMLLKGDLPVARSSVLFFLPESDSASSATQLNFLNQQIDTVLGLTKSDEVAQKVIDELDLGISVAGFKDVASSSRAEDASTVTFAYRDADTEQGVRVVEKLIDETLRKYQDELGEPTQRILSQIDERIAALEPQIQDADRQIAEFLAARGIGSIDSARQAANGVVEHTTALRDAIASGNQLGSTGTAQSLIDAHREELAELARSESQLNELLRRKKVLDARLDALIEQQSDARRSEAETLRRVRVQTLGEPVVVPTDTKGIVLRIGAAFVLGMLVGVVIVILMDVFDKSIRTMDDAERLSGAPVLAVIPTIEGFENRRASAASGPNPRPRAAASS